jgi:hypothetical protein
MGCGKSKLDVASGNTIPQSKKSSAGVDASKVGHENGTQANNNDVSKLEEHKKSDENVKQVVVDKPNVIVAPDEITNNVQQDNELEKKNQEADVDKPKSEEIVVTEVKEDSLENDNQPEAAKEEKSPENGKGMQKSLSL